MQPPHPRRISLSLPPPSRSFSFASPSVSRRLPRPFRRKSLSGRPPPPSYLPPTSSRPPSPAFSRSSPSRVRSAAPPTLEVFGDSFASVFTLLGNKARVHKYKGASARGLNNPASTMQVGPDVLQQMSTSNAGAFLLLFGNVDLHINYLWQLKARGQAASSPSEWVQKVATDYAAFLAQRIVPLAQRKGVKVYVAGVTPPVVEDRYLEYSAQKYLSKESVGPLPPLSAASYPTDLTTRASMVKRFNLVLGNFCARYPCLQFVDISKHVVSPSNPRQVDRRFVDPEDPLNLHLVWESTVHFWCREIPLLSSSAPSRPEDLTSLQRSLDAWRLEKRERMRHNPLTAVYA
ncbi:hypothetical protein JCM10207_005005 [Rhodosporidiobolus poonsookiae]